ncbi:MAG: hypothetical protein ACP6IP_04255 [Candidatus Njordarchaeia archaeon]
MICPICDKDVKDLSSHFVNEHGLDCDCGYTVLLDFFELYRAEKLKPIVKCLEDYTFDDFLSFLKASDQLLGDDDPFDHPGVEYLVEVIASKIGEGEVDALCDLAKRDPDSSSSYIAFYTLTRSKSEKALPALLKLSIHGVYSDNVDLFGEYLDGLGDGSIDAFKRYAPESYPFNLDMFYELFVNRFGEKAIEVFIDVLERLPSGKLIENGEEAYIFLDFAYGLSKIKFGTNKMDSVKKLLKLIVAKFENVENLDAIDADYVYDALTLFDGLAHVFTSNTGVIAWSKVSREELDNLLKKFSLHILTRVITEKENIVKVKLVLDKVTIEDLGEVLKVFKYNVLKIMFIEFFTKLLYHYGDLRLAKFLIEEGLPLAERYNLKNVTSDLLYLYIRIQLMWEGLENVDKLLWKYENLRFPNDKDLEQFHKFDILKLKFLYAILKGNYGEAIETAKKLETSEDSYFHESEYWDWLNILKAYAYYKIGSEKNALRSLRWVSIEMSLDELELAKRLMFLQWQFTVKDFDGLLKKLMRKPSDKVLFLDYARLHIPGVFEDFLRYAISKYPDDPELNYYYAIINLKKGEEMKAYKNYIKAYKSKVISRKQIAQNILHILLLWEHLELAEKIYSKLAKHFSAREKILIEIFKAISRGEDIKAKKIAKQLKKINPEDYYHIIKLLKKGKISEGFLPITYLGNPKNKILKMYPMIE